MLAWPLPRLCLLFFFQQFEYGGECGFPKMCDCLLKFIMTHLLLIIWRLCTIVLVMIQRLHFFPSAYVKSCILGVTTMYFPFVCFTVVWIFFIFFLQEA